MPSFTRLAIETAYNLPTTLAEATLSYCVLYEDGARFPESGWLQGSVEDLADLVRLVSMPQKEVDRAADILETGIEAAAELMDKMAEVRPGISAEIADLLGMVDVTQTRRMACAILANALGISRTHCRNAPGRCHAAETQRHRGGERFRMPFSMPGPLFSRSITTPYSPLPRIFSPIFRHRTPLRFCKNCFPRRGRLTPPAWTTPTT